MWIMLKKGHLLQIRARCRGDLEALQEEHNLGRIVETTDGSAGYPYRIMVGQRSNYDEARPDDEIIAEMKLDEPEPEQIPF